MLDPVAGALLVLGLGYAIWNIRRPAFQLLLVWVAGYVVSVALTVDPPPSARLVGMTLPIAILNAVALNRILEFLPRGRRGAVAALVIGLVVVLASGVRNWRDYANWAQDPKTATPRMHVVRFPWRMPPDYQVRTVSHAFGWP